MQLKFGFSFILILLLGYLNIQYFAECAPANHGQVQRTLSTTARTTMKTTTTTRPTREPRMNCDASSQIIGLHPVSQLHEIQAKNHKHHPLFKDIGRRGQQNENNIEFQVQVTVNGRSASAWGHTKKEAKRRAVIAMLTLMGVSIEAEQSNSIKNC